MGNRIVHAPLSFHASKPGDESENPIILDIGCGTGIATRHLGEQYPQAKVYGIDIGNVPPHPRTPPNVDYIKGDIKKLAGEAMSPFQPGTVDYIFQRLLVCGMTDWSGYVRQMKRLLKPGGWIEIHDYAEIAYKRTLVTKSDATAKEEFEDVLISQDWKWQHAMRRGAAVLGLDLDIGLHASRYLEDAGFTTVTSTGYEVPFGTFMADDPDPTRAKPQTRSIGRHQVKDLGEVFAESVLPGVTRTLGLGQEELRSLKKECRVCLGEEDGKFWWFYAVCGQKA